MEPTLHHNDIVFSDHFFPKIRGIRYGDIVVAKSVSDPKLLVCKRVTALEGDVVLYYNRYVFVSIIFVKFYYFYNFVNRWTPKSFNFF